MRTCTLKCCWSLLNVHYCFVPFCSNSCMQTGLAGHANKSSDRGAHKRPIKLPSKCYQTPISLPSPAATACSSPAPHCHPDMQKPRCCSFKSHFITPFYFPRLSVITAPGRMLLRFHFLSQKNKISKMALSVNGQNNRLAFKGPPHSVPAGGIETCRIEGSVTRFTIQTRNTTAYYKFDTGPGDYRIHLCICDKHFHVSGRMWWYNI